MNNSQILGHEKTLAFLDKVVESGRPSHAYIFSGQEGIGKRAVALRFCAMLTYSEQEPTHQQSSEARLIYNENHPDLRIASPVRGIIRIDQIRELRTFFKYEPIQGRFRTVIIDDAHCMNPQAQNALLKTLEEPPPSGMIILVTSQPALLLPTVRSRCRLLSFSPIQREILTDYLVDKKNMSHMEAATLAGLAQGSFSKATQLMESPALEFRSTIINALLGQTDRGLSEILDLSSRISSDRSRSQFAVQMIISWLRDVLVVQSDGDPDTLINRDILDTIEFAAENLRERQIVEVSELFSAASAKLGSPTNINRNLILDVTLLRAAQILAGPFMGLKPV